MSDDKTGQKVSISQKSTNQTKYDSELVVFEEIITHHPTTGSATGVERIKYIHAPTLAVKTVQYEVSNSMFDFVGHLFDFVGHIEKKSDRHRSIECMYEQKGCPYTSIKRERV